MYERGKKWKQKRKRKEKEKQKKTEENERKPKKTKKTTTTTKKKKKKKGKCIEADLFLIFFFDFSCDFSAFSIILGFFFLGGGVRSDARVHDGS